MIRNIIFDFGKVLVDYDFDSVIDTFFTDSDECRRFKGLVCSDEFINRCDKEDTPITQIIAEEQRRHPEWEVPLQLFLDRFGECVTGEVPGMRTLLAKLRSQGFALYGLTNWSSLVHPIIARYDILRMLDDRLISSEEHLLKPDTRIYRRICDKFGLQADECLFTDDRPVNVEGARAAGMHAIVFRNALQFEDELLQYISPIR